MAEVCMSSFELKGEYPVMENFVKTFKKITVKNNSYFAILCDGHLGPEAAKFTVNFLHTQILKSVDVFFKDDKSVQEFLLSLFEQTQQAMESVYENWSSAQDFPSPSGCTCTLVVVSNRIIVASIGDSRAMLLDNNGTVVLTPIHRLSKPGELVRVKARGGTIHLNNDIQEVVFRLENRKAGVVREIRSELTRSLGDFYAINNFGISILGRLPDINCYDLKQIHTIILGCDGLWDVASKSEVIGIVSEVGSAVVKSDFNAAEKISSLASTKYLESSKPREDVSCVVLHLSFMADISHEKSSRIPKTKNPFVKPAADKKPVKRTKLLEEIDKTNLQKMWSEKEVTGDASFTIFGKHIIRAHSSILMWQSEYLKKQIETQRRMKSITKFTINSDRHSIQALEMCVEYMYFKVIQNINPSELSSLKYTADVFKLRDIFNYAMSKVVSSSLSVSNLVYIIPNICLKKCDSGTSVLLTEFVKKNLETIGSQEDVIKVLKEHSEKTLDIIFNIKTT